MALTPRVFISFATPDESDAVRLKAALADEGIEAFVAHRDISSGANIVLDIERQLAVADYFVLLLSRHSLDRPWVELEWTSALFHELQQHRAFLFVVRLDDVRVPIVLCARRYLDAGGDVGSVVPGLVRAWRLDVRQDLDGAPRRPAPNLDLSPADEETVGIYVMNRRGPVQHFMRVPRRLSCRQLQARVLSALELTPSSHGIVGDLRFGLRYELSRAGDVLAADSDEQVELIDETVIDLVALIRLPEGAERSRSGDVVFRSVADAAAAAGVSEREVDTAIRRAVRHLMP